MNNAVYDTRSGNWYIRTIDNKLIAWAVQFGGPDMLPVAGDFDGDGVFDLAVYDYATGISALSTDAFWNGRCRLAMKQ